MSEDSSIEAEPGRDNSPDKPLPEEPDKPLPEESDSTPSSTSSVAAPPTGPLPLGEAIRQLPDQYIRVLTRPGVAVFSQEQDKAAWNITCAQLLISSVVAALVGLVQFNTTLPNSLTNSHVPQLIQLFRTFSGAFALGYLILTPIFFFIGMGLYYLFARAFGGKGTFLAYCYSSLLYAVPINIIAGLFSAIVGLLGLPTFVNSLVSGLIGIYGIVLQVFATMSVHRLSGGKATLAVILVPIILFVFFFLVSLVGIFVFIAGHPH